MRLFKNKNESHTAPAASPQMSEASQMNESTQNHKGFWARARNYVLSGGANLRENLTDVLDKDSRFDNSLRGEELHMFRNLLGFKYVRVENVMVPRADIVAVDETISLDELAARFTECKHSRLPVYRETLDDPIGMVHVKDVFSMLADKAPKMPLAKLRRDVLFAPPSMRGLDLLLRMQATQLHMALVVDEYGGTDGLVTIEDLVEEIIGEIKDEHDEQITPQLVERANGVFEAQARLPVAILEAHLGFPLLEQEADIDTLGGLVFSLIGHVPQRGEVISHKTGIEFEILDADPRRIKFLRIRYRPQAQKEQKQAG